MLLSEMGFSRSKEREWAAKATVGFASESARTRVRPLQFPV